MNPYYRRPSLFWPIILIGVGLIFLLNNLGYMQGNPWGLIWQFWPVLLIAIGLDILFGRRSALGSLISAGLALLVVVGVIWLLIARPAIDLPGLNLGGELQTRHVEAPLSDIREAHVSIDFGTGHNEIYALGDSSKLVEGDLSYYGSLRFGVSGSGGDATIRIERDNFSFGFLGSSEDWRIGLNQRVTYDLDLNLGVGQSTIDLSRLSLSGGQFDVGVGSAEMRLPSSGRFRLSINGGIGSLRIIVPRDVALRAEVDTGIGSFNPGGRMRSVGEDTYETEGFGSADNAITLIVDVGIGSVTLQDQ